MVTKTDGPLQPLPLQGIQWKALVRHDGYLALDNYAAIGKGRSVALSGTDGSIDWWCVPNMDSPPLFDRLLDAEKGGRFSIVPTGLFEVERSFRNGSNVLEPFSSPLLGGPE